MVCKCTMYIVGESNPDWRFISCLQRRDKPGLHSTATAASCDGYKYKDKKDKKTGMFIRAEAILWLLNLCSVRAHNVVIFSLVAFLSVKRGVCHNWSFLLQQIKSPSQFYILFATVTIDLPQRQQLS